MFSSRTTRARRARIAVALLGTVASLALPSFATAGGITAVPEPAAGWEGHQPGNNPLISVWSTITCQPTNVMVQWCRYRAVYRDGTAQQFSSGNYGNTSDYAPTGTITYHTLDRGKSQRLAAWGVFPQGDTRVEPNETLTMVAEAEGMLGQMVVEKTVSAPVQITIWNDDYTPGQAPGPWAAPRKTTCWTCKP